MRINNNLRRNNRHVGDKKYTRKNSYSLQDVVAADVDTLIMVSADRKLNPKVH
jgi:hypothetical protein